MNYRGLQAVFTVFFSIGLVQAESTIDGHLAGLVQQDSLDTQAVAVQATVPFTDRWALEGAYSATSGTYDLSNQTSESFESIQYQLGFLFDAGPWHVGVSGMSFEDGSLLTTQQFKLRLGNQLESFAINLEAMGREHDISLILPNRSFDETFRSVGAGVDLSYLWKSGFRAYLGGQSYDYEGSELLNAEFRNLLIIALQYPELAERVLNLYRQLVSQQQRAQGGLTSKNLWAGVEYQWRNELFALDHYISVAEIDGAEFITDSFLWSHAFGRNFLLDVTVGLAKGDGVETSEYAGLGIHLYW